VKAADELCGHDGCGLRRSVHQQAAWSGAERREVTIEERLGHAFTPSGVFSHPGEGSPDSYCGRVYRHAPHGWAKTGQEPGVCSGQPLPQDISVLPGQPARGSLRELEAMAAHWAETGRLESEGPFAVSSGTVQRAGLEIRAWIAARRQFDAGAGG
jgi:hypothetical protein